GVAGNAASKQRHRRGSAERSQSDASATLWRHRTFSWPAFYPLTAPPTIRSFAGYAWCMGGCPRGERSEATLVSRVRCSEKPAPSGAPSRGQGSGQPIVLEWPVSEQGKQGRVFQDNFRGGATWMRGRGTYKRISPASTSRSCGSRVYPTRAQV